MPDATVWLAVSGLVTLVFFAVLALLGPVRVQILSPGYEGAPEDVT